MKHNSALLKIGAIVLSLCITATLYAGRVLAIENETVIKSCSSKKKKIALTFDDGPHPKRTAEILEILDEYGIKATFFVIGENVALYPELVQREIDAGHEIGNHTTNHKSLLKASTKELSEEIGGLSRILEEKFDRKISLTRPPGGQFNENLPPYAEENGYKIILWSVDTRDWAHTPVADIYANVMKNTGDGAIILFHDYVSGKSPTPEALRQIIPALLDEGYEFVTVSELIG